jgi:enoyl-CoA hydratase/carnithine racemase
MEKFSTITYSVDGRIARITLNRPGRGNGITLEMPRELAASVELANLDPDVHVIALAGNGPGFCGGYDLAAAEEIGERPSPAASSAGSSRTGGPASLPPGSPVDPEVIAANHDPSRVWDPVVDFQMMSRNARGFMSLFHGEKPVVCKVHGFCVAGGTDMALCSDLLVVEDEAKIGYPPARVWGAPTTALWAWRVGPARAKRLLLTGDSISGAEAVEWGLAAESAPADRLDERFEALLRRVAKLPLNQLVLHKLLVNQALYAQGLHSTQVLGTIFDGIARHTPEGYAFASRSTEQGWREAVRERDEPFGDLGSSTFKG